MDLDAYLAGLALSDDGARVYVGSFDESAVLELDAETLALRRRLPIAPRFGGLWDLVVVPEREQLYASDLGGSGVAVLDLSTGTQLATVPLPVSPAGLVATRDTVFAAVSGSDMVAAIDVATRSVVATSEVFDQFTYVLLPNDHTNGTVPGTPTPESMVADNDYAMGLLIDAISHSPYWPFTAIFVVEDDPQGSEDHVDAHRSILHVISPWARRGYVSHAQTSWLSVFATLERILGVPPVGRPDAAAAPLYDFFTTTPDFTPYDARERLHPRELNGETTVGADRSREMDFRSPDRNPDLGALVRAYRAWRRGEIERDEAERRIERAAREALHEDADAAIDEAAIERAKGDRDELVDEAAVERAAFDHEWPRYVQWHLERYGVAPAEPPGAPTRIRRPD